MNTHRVLFSVFLSAAAVPLAVGAPPEIRMIYLVPAHKVARSDYAVAMKNAIKHLQIWLHEEMPGGETISLHDPVVEVYTTAHDSSWYRENNSGDFSLRFWFNVLADGFAITGGRFNDPDNRWTFYIDAHPACGQVTGGTSGVALLPANDLRGLAGEVNIPPCTGQSPDTNGVCRWVGGLGHELGRALLLPHPPGCETGEPSCPSYTLMWFGYITYPSTYLLPADVATLLGGGFFTAQDPGVPLFPCASLDQQWFVRGDANADGSVDIGDAIYSLTALFARGELPPCMKGGDANDDGAFDIGDPVQVLNYLFGGTRGLAEPSPRCGLDPTPDALSCRSQGPCNDV